MPEVEYQQMIDENDLILRILKLGSFTRYSSTQFRFQSLTSDVFELSKNKYEFNEEEI